MLTYDQISDIRVDLLAIYSQKELILHYHNLLDFRFAQGSIAFTQNLIVYTIKIPILNPIEFSLIQRLAIINHNNQTEVITTPWSLTQSSIKLFANKCRQMYERNFLCQQIINEKVKPIIISISPPLILTYKLSENLTLVSSNYPIKVKHDNDQMVIRGTYEIQGNDVQIQGYRLDENIGELEQSSLIPPLIIKDHQLNFDPLKTFTSPTLNMPNFSQIRTEFIMSTSSIILVLLFITVTSVYLIYKIKVKKQRPQLTKKPNDKNINDEDVIELGRGGVM